MSRIFLSHSSLDNFEALALRDWLASEGWDDVFLDLDPERGIAAGERWERALHAAASRCEAVIFLVSDRWLASGWCLKEYALARGLNKKLFAVLIEGEKKIADLPPELKGTWQVIDLAGGQDLQLFRVALPSSHEEKHVGFSREGLRRLKRGLEKAGLDPKFFAWPPAQEPQRAPYRGLKPLEAADAGIFFGRDAPIVEATDRLRGLAAGAPPRLLVILGASGAGKSSFLRAGLLPRLARDDAHFLVLPPLRPERAALSGESGFLGALEAAAPERTRAELRAAVREGAKGVRPLFAGLIAKAAGQRIGSDDAQRPPAIVIAVDQAEELFRAEGAEEGAALLDLLRDLAITDDPAIIALFAIRSDAYDALEHARALEGLPQATLPLLPMPRGAYKEVIEGPARRVAEAGGRLAIEPQLTQRLLEDIERGGGSDALPLLAFTLEQLFLEYGRAGQLRLADYEAFGGLKGAIDAAVERAFKRADADHRIPRERAAREALLRRGLIPWLAGIDPDTKSPRRNIARRTDIPAEAAPLIDLLVEERLLSSDTALAKDAVTGADIRQATIEPAHEALLRQWGLLHGWLEEDFALLATLEGVKRAARDWDANRSAEAWLAHQGQRLAEAQGLDARPDIAARLDQTDRAYLAQCQAREEAARAAAEQRRREREEEQARRLADAQAIAAANKRTAQRTGIGLVAALVLALAAGGFGIYAQNERAIADRQTQEAQQQRDRAEAAKKEAQAQRDRAERALKTAVDTANALVLGLAQKFRNVAGMPASLVKSILDLALNLQSNLIGAGENDPDLRFSQAVALSEAASSFLTIGDTQGALAAAQKSRDIIEDLLKEQPANALWRRNLAVILAEIGDVELAMGDLRQALTAYQESLAACRDLVADKSDADSRHLLSSALQRMGEAKLRASDPSGGLAALEESLAIMRELAKDKANREARRDLAILLARVGAVKQRLSDQEAALALYTESLAIFRELATDKSDAVAEHGLAGVLYAIASAKLRQNDFAGALALYEEALPLFRDLAKDKTNALNQRDLLDELTRVGETKLRLGDLAGALAAYTESLAIARESAKDKNKAYGSLDLAGSLEKIGDVKLRVGDLAGALASYTEELAILREGAKGKSSAQAQANISGILSKIGDVKLQEGDLAGALAAYEESLAIFRELAKGKGDKQAQRNLSVGLEKIGDAKLAAGQLAEALAAYEQGLAIDRDLARDATDPQDERDLAISLNKIGDVKLQSSDLPGALAAYEESLAISRKLAKDKSNIQVQSDLSAVLERVGDVKLQLGDWAQAAAYFEESVAISRALAKDKTDAQAQRDLAVGLDDIGDAKLRGGDLAGALAAYEEGLAIFRALAGNKSNAQAQRDLSIILNRIGDAKRRAGDLAGALAAYEESVAIGHALAKDGDNAQAQRYLAITLSKLAQTLVKQGKLRDAFDYFKQSLTIDRQLAAGGNRQSQAALRSDAEDIGDIAYSFLLARDFARALEAADLSVTLAPDIAWLYTNCAHALMFLGRTDEARSVYLTHRGEKTLDGKSWEAAVLADFGDFRKAGLTNPLMDEIEKAFATSGKS